MPLSAPPVIRRLKGARALFLRHGTRFPPAVLPTNQRHHPPLPVKDPSIQAIADRVRSVIADEPRQSIDLLVATLRADPDEVRSLLEGSATVDVALLIDLVAALVHEFAVDPQWLLTGHYNPTVHRRALLLAEDRGIDGERAIRQLVREQYYKLVP